MKNPNNQSGKGSRPRPVNGEVFQRNWEAIFRKKEEKIMKPYGKAWDDFLKRSQPPIPPTVPESYAFGKGWDACKAEVLEILSRPIVNLDLSTDSCDHRWIDEIREL